VIGATNRIDSVDPALRRPGDYYYIYIYIMYREI
jgi:SpoVK/Ycf46/Vps4 family AAA+-type ATPase